MRRAAYSVGGLLLLSCGILLLIVSILSEASILAFVGLGLTFWGALFLFLRSERYVKSKLLDPTMASTLETLSRILTELGYKGKAVYLPPKYLTDLKSGLVYITERENVRNLPLEEVSEENIFATNPAGIQIKPPGLSLTNLFEEELGTDFMRADLKYLRDNLPKLFIENLEIAQGLEINMNDNLVNIKIKDSVYTDFCRQAEKFSNLCNSIGCPLCSSIAIALTRATGKSVVIEECGYSEDDKTINVQYRVLEE